jgi:hypothetical protein
MKELIVVVAILMFASLAYADGAMEMKIGEAVPAPAPDVEFYCQPPHVNLQTLNANTGFGSEVVDDIPGAYAGTDIGDIVFYVSEWGAAWIDPSGVNINIYYSKCAPGLVPDATYYIGWAQLNAQIYYDDPGNFTTYRCTAYLPGPLPIQASMSIGFQVVTTWGTNVPYTGIVLTDDYAVYGDCEGYMDPTYWGYPRWTALSPLLGIPYDVAYCLSAVEECSGGDVTYLTCLSDCYETVYKFNITAGTCAVNDMEICIYNADNWQPVDIEVCSVPIDGWICGHNEGPNCAYFETAENPLPAGETFGPFDFGTTGGVVPVIAVVWTFTYDGRVVAGPDTTYFICGASATRPSSWGGIKSLYR